MRILCIHLPNWPLQCLLAANRELDPQRPILLHAPDARRGQQVTACNPAAWKQGVRPGMPLAEAAVLAGRKHFRFPCTRAADQAALARLAEHCERFSPLVGLDTIDETLAEPDRLLLDITGIGVLIGGEDSLAREVTSDLNQLGYVACLAIAETIGAAWAQAAFAEPLPVAALRLPADTIDLLAQLGVTTIEQLLRLPRASLPSRFGSQLVLRLDQFLGAATETIVAHRPPPEFSVEMILEHPAERIEQIEIVVRDLLDRLVCRLAQRRQGAVRLICRLYAPFPFLVQIGLFRPTADARHLWGLLREQLRPPGPVGRVLLAAVLTAPLENRQQKLFAGNREEEVRQWELLIDRLSSRLGAEAVLRPALTADPVPERAVSYTPLLEVRKSKKRTTVSQRPLLLRTTPLPLAVVSVVPDGAPGSFWLQGRQERVARCWGPERIESGWWRGVSVRRDYYGVETEQGERYWLFHRLQDGQWFLHGEFA